MIYTSTFGLSERIESLELLADEWQRRALDAAEPVHADETATSDVSVSAP